MKNIGKFAKQFSRYFGAALVGYVIDVATLVLLHGILGVHYLVAATAGFILGLVVLYYLSKRYVFGESKLKSRKSEFILFTLVGLVGLVILAVFMWVFTDVLALNYLLSKILATVFVYLWNFIARRSLYHDTK